MSLLKLPQLRSLAAALALSLLAPAAQAAEKIRFGLSWLPEAEHCGFFQAKAAGLYDKAGLDVEIVPGGPAANNPLLLAAGKLDLAMGSSFTTLNMQSAGADGVTVAAFFQKDPQTLVAHADEGVSTLTDLKGRPIMIAKFSIQEFWQFLKQKYGFTDDQLRPYTYDAAPFLADPKAVQQGYVTEDAMLLGEHLPKPPVILLLADYGYDNYATTVYGMRPWLEAHADAVKKFVAASAEGYKQCDAGEAPEGMKLLLEMNPDHSEALYHFKLKEIRDRKMVTGGDAEKLGIGAMTDARWRNFFDTMSNAGVYPKSLDYTKAYTLKFVGG
jgi:NitT/TauT family transport system substrate-binding protein